MRKLTRVVVVVAIGVVLLMAASLPAAGGPANPFVGSWENSDAFDGSHQHVSIGGSGHFRYRDDGSSACEDGGFGFVPASLSGFGEFVPGPGFAFTADLFCHTRGGGGRQFLLQASLTFSYDAATDTLSDSAGQGCWYRSGRPETCASGA